MKNCIFLLMMMVASISYAQKAIPLYPYSIPNARPTPAGYIEKNDKGWVTDVSLPTITPYFPAVGMTNGTAVIIFPGGGYAGLSMINEGSEVAKAFNNLGVTAFVVKYRLPNDSIMVDKTIGPLQDAQQAVLMVRRRAAAWKIDPAKVGIIGFSAGGHLASTLGTHYSKVLVDDKEKLSARPDFMMLLYPVISFGPMAHVGSKENLVGKHPDQALMDYFSNEKQVTADTPPTFLVHAEDDTVVPVQNTLMFYDSLLADKIKGEMHIFEAGGHGFGLNNVQSKDKWIDWAKNWLGENGFLETGKK